MSVGEKGWLVTFEPEKAKRPTVAELPAEYKWGVEQ